MCEYIIIHAMHEEIYGMLIRHVGQLKENYGNIKLTSCISGIFHCHSLQDQPLGLNHILVAAMLLLHRLL
jgi:hypothetical protein